MITEIELLREDIPRLEIKFGAGNVFVKLLKAQLAFLQNQMETQPQRDLPHPGFENSKRSPNQRNGAANKLGRVWP